MYQQPLQHRQTRSNAQFAPQVPKLPTLSTWASAPVIPTMQNAPAGPHHTPPHSFIPPAPPGVNPQQWQNGRRMYTGPAGGATKRTSPKSIPASQPRWLERSIRLGRHPTVSPRLRCKSSLNHPIGTRSSPIIGSVLRTCISSTHHLLLTGHITNSVREKGSQWCIQHLVGRARHLIPPGCGFLASWKTTICPFSESSRAALLL
jgi:hypothetical protein